MNKKTEEYLVNLNKKKFDNFKTTYVLIITFYIEKNSYLEVTWLTLITIFNMD